MKGFAAASAIAAAGLFARSVTATVPPIEIKGSKFFYSNNGSQFFIKGVAYQQDYTGGGAGSSGSGSTASGQTYVDNLADPAGCQRDLPYLLELQTNVIRSYAINPDENHDECMNMFADAGIYLFADLGAPVPNESINQDDPYWNDDLYARYASVIDALSKYPNTIGFFAGNEVANAPNNTNTMPFVKAAVRDMKAYIKKTASRPLYVGYAADDDQSIRVPVSEFMNCGDQDDAVDFWGYNIYEWCGPSATFQSSGYAARTQEFSTFSVPVFFAEYGCIIPPPRTFEDTPVLLGPQMDQVWSGGIVYMYFQEVNDYGLVSVTGNTVSKLPDFSSLSIEIAKASPTGPNSAAYTPSNTPAACPTEGANWEAASSPLPPTPNKELCQCMVDSLTCSVASSTVNTNEYIDDFNYVCGLQGGIYCKGITANGTTGDYGAYSMCEDTEKLSFVFNEYYQANSHNSDACDFKGLAATKSSSVAAACTPLLNQAGKSGTGDVTAVPSGTGAGAAGSTGSATSSGAGVPSTVPRVESGLLPAAFLLTVACVSGMGMILL